MKKPKRKELKLNSSVEEYKRIGYDLCWDEWEKWLPSDQELYDLVLNCLGRLDSKTTKLVKAISKRLRSVK